VSLTGLVAMMRLRVESELVGCSEGDAVNAIAVVVLICSASLSRSECQLNTASNVIRGPNVANDVMCALSGQSTLAATTLAPNGPDEYTKILCMRFAPQSQSPELVPAVQEEPLDVDAEDEYLST
jgi:hypothetical protein